MQTDVAIGIFVAGYWVLLTCACVVAIRFDKHVKKEEDNSEEFTEMV